MTKYTAW